MSRTLNRPQNPEAVGRVVAALRLLAGQRQPRNKAEREVLAAIRAEGVRAAVAKRLVGNFDGVPNNTRNKLLGKPGTPAYLPPAKVDRVNANGPFPTVNVPVGAITNILGGVQPAIPVAVQPVYTLRYRGLYCQEESTWDQGSTDDEIYMVTSAVHIDENGKNVVRTERQPKAQNQTHYEDIDTGEERIGPVSACWQGNSDPVSLTVVVFEHDQGDPNAYRDDVDSIVKAAIAIATIFYPEAAAALLYVREFMTDTLNWLLGTGDDLIDTQTVINPKQNLEWYAGQPMHLYVGKQLQLTPLGLQLKDAPTHLLHHFATTHKGGGATYVVGFEVTRNPALPIPDEIIP